MFVINFLQRSQVKKWRQTFQKTATYTNSALESSKCASFLFDQGFQVWDGWNRLERHLSVFCIDRITPGFVVYHVNSQPLILCPVANVGHCSLFCIKNVSISKSETSWTHSRIKNYHTALSPTAMICRKVHFHMAESFDNVRISKFQNPFAGDKMMFDDGAAALSFSIKKELGYMESSL